MALLGSSRNNLISLNSKGNNTLMGLNVMLHTNESDFGIENLYGEPVVCISVIDESNNLIPGVGSPQDAITIENDFNDFRANYPSRPFYLLQPIGTNSFGQGKNNEKSDVLIPASVIDDNPVGIGTTYGLFYSEVNRDSGSPAAASDWFTICGLSTYPANTLVSLFIDTSGSMTLGTVQASYDKFLQDCENNSIVIAGNSFNQGERWAVDHNKSFGELIDLVTVVRILNQNVPFYTDGIFLEALQDSLLDKKIGTDLERFPNLYGYMGQKGRNSSAGTISITNPDGSLSINNSFIRGEATGTATSTTWVNDYYSNVNNHTINVCDVTKNLPDGGRLISPDSSGFNSSDVHGNIFSLFTTPNRIRSQEPGFFGEVLSSPTRRECYTLIITDSKEQTDGPGDLIDQEIELLSDQTEIVTGFNAVRYSGYFGDSISTSGDTDNVNYDQIAQLDTDVISGYPNPVILDKFDNFFSGSEGVFTDKTWVISGFFKPPANANYAFRITSDDGSYMHLKNPAGDFIIERTSGQDEDGFETSPGSEGFTRENALINNGGRHSSRSVRTPQNIYLEKDVLYPVRFIYGNKEGESGNPTLFTFEWKRNETIFPDPFKTDGTNVFFTNSNPITERRINSVSNVVKSEPQFRRYRVIALSAYTSSDNYDGVLFYGSGYEQPYAYVKFTGTNANDFTITRDDSFKENRWTKNTNQKQDTLTIAQETQGGLFISANVYGDNDYRKPFAEVISQFMEDTLN